MSKSKKNIVAKLTAEQIEKDCPTSVEQWGRQIAAHYKKALQYQGKVEDNWNAIGQYLAQARDACDDGGFEAFRSRFCSHLRKSRVYELLQIGSGEKTFEDLRAEKRESVRRHRAAKAAAVSTTVVDTPAVSDETVRLNGGQAIDIGKLSPAAQAQLAKKLLPDEPATGEATITSYKDDYDSLRHAFEGEMDWWLGPISRMPAKMFCGVVYTSDLRSVGDFLLRVADEQSKEEATNNGDHDETRRAELQAWHERLQGYLEGCKASCIEAGENWNDDIKAEYAAMYDEHDGG